MRISTSLCFLIILSMYAIPAMADDKSVVGNWKLVAMEINGAPAEDDDVGNRRVVFTKDGKMEAWDEENKDDEGWYELKKDNKLVVYVDEDADGVLDEEEKSEGFELTWSRKDSELTLSAPMGEEGEQDAPVMTLKLKLIEEE